MLFHSLIIDFGQKLGAVKIPDEKEFEKNELLNVKLVDG